MRRWWLAVLPLFWSCADNLPDAPVESARLETVEIPDLIVAGWPEALEFRVQAVVPDEGEWSVALRVSGPGLDPAVDYLLLDDGDYLELAHPGPGQAVHSGDNVPGDGWFSTRISADFSPELGSFTLRAMLLKDGVEQDFRQTSRVRLENRAPEIVALEAPSALPSGGSYTVSLTGTDPDGPADLASASLTQVSGVMRSWPFTRQNDSLFALSVGPELAAGRQGADTLTVELLDRVGNASLRDVVVDLENGPPTLDETALAAWQILEDDSFVPLDFGDTLHLYVPGTDPLVFNLYQFAIAAADPQTLLDLSAVTWEIDPIGGNPSEPQTEMTESSVPGVYTANIRLNGHPTGYVNTIYNLRLRAFDAFHEPALVARMIRIHNPGDAAPPGPRGRVAATGAGQLRGPVYVIGQEGGR